MPRDDELERLLRSWGDAQIGRHDAANEDRREHDPGSHPISKARQFAPMTREKFQNQLVGRDGGDRRRLMARASGVRGMKIIPMWACDPVSGKETRHMGPVASVDRGLPPELRLIDRALMDLYRANTMRGLVLRIEYTGFGRHVEKAGEVARAMRIPELPVRKYRDELRMGREWLRIELRIAA